jgi:hypothetical protein
MDVLTKENPVMSMPRYAYPRDMREYEKKLRQNDPVRSLVLNLVGIFIVVTVVGVALLVAVLPPMSLYLMVRVLIGHD